MSTSLRKMASEQQFNIKFVEEVEKYPYLYNSRLPEYMRKDTTEKAWREIGNQFKLTGPECKEKWKNLRTVFVRNLKPLKNGSVTTRRPYYLAEYMQFAVPFIKLRKYSENITDASNEVYLNDEHFSSLHQSQSVDISSPEEPQEISTRYRVKQEPSIQIEEIMFTSPSPQPMLQPSTSSSTQQAGYGQHEQRRPKKTFRKRCESAEESSNKMFLLSILLDMNKMDDQQRRAFKRKLLELVDETLEQSASKVSRQNNSSDSE